MKKIFALFVTLALAVTIVAQQPVVVPPATAAGATDSLVQFMPSTVGPYCPKRLLGGDREFGGHGPEIYAWVKLNIVNKRTVEAEVFMHARETVADWSETQGNWKKVLYTAPAGYEITAIVSGKYSEVKYVSRPGVNAFSPAGLVQALGNIRSGNVPFKDDGLVTRWNIIGDTGGDDISTDDNCNDDAQVAIQLNPVKIKLRKLQRTNRIVRPAGNTSNDGVVVTPPANNSSNGVVVTPPAGNNNNSGVVVTPPASSSVTTIQLEDIKEAFCPQKVISGDREFDGHGPRVQSTVRLRISPDKTSLIADFNLLAKETTADWSNTRGDWSRTVYKAPAGKKITEIVSDKVSTTKFISPPGGFQFLVPGADVAQALYTFLDYTDIKSAVLKAFGYGPNEKSALSALVKGTIDHGNTVVQVPSVDGALVKFFHIVGDTGGPDISDDNNCNDDTRIVKIEFFPAKIKLENINSVKISNKMRRAR